MKKKEPVYIIGHRHPDTDSVASAIAYAFFKRSMGVQAIPCRLGALNGETRYLLSRFGFQEPALLQDARMKLSGLLRIRYLTPCRRCSNLSINLEDPDVVLPQKQTPKIDKYDPMVPEALLRSAFLYNQMDVPSAIGILQEIETTARSEKVHLND